MIPAGILHETQHPLWDSRRLWSLWDAMIDMNLGIFLFALSQLDVIRVHAASGDPDEFPGDDVIATLHDKLMALKLTAERLAMPTVLARIKKIEAYFNEGVRSTNGQLFHELEELSDAIQHDAKDEYFFHYPREAAKLALDVLRDTDPEWAKITTAFPSSKREKEAAVDCFAFGDFSGCVFHMVRIAELGLRAIAEERGVTTVAKGRPLEYGMWHDVFVAIDGQLSLIRNKPVGPNRDAAMAFYQGAISDLRFLQLYRDPTMHFREEYGKGEAYDALHRVKTLMTKLATKLSEGQITPIDWNL